MRPRVLYSWRQWFCNARSGGEEELVDVGGRGRRAARGEALRARKEEERAEGNKSDTYTLAHVPNNDVWGGCKGK